MQVEARNPLQTSPSSLVPVCTARFGSWHLALQRRALTHTQIRDNYEAAASAWPRKARRLNSPEAYGTFLAAALGALPPKPLTVLDCGIGCGALSAAMAATSRQPLTLHGIDASPAMLAEARKHLGAIPATLREGDVHTLPYPDAAFDITIAAHLLEHLADPATALAEIARTTRPGGLVLLCLTRRSLTGLWVHLRWRTHLFSAPMANALIESAGLQPLHTAPLPGRRFSPHPSLACIARKPF